MNTSLIRERRPWVAFAMLLLAVLIIVRTAPLFAANPAPVQVFYLTEPEDDMLTAMLDMGTAGATPRSPMVTKITIAISADNTIVYYDHWENGFAGDIANPTASEIYSPGLPAGVQIWGNGNIADGCAPTIRGVPVDCTDDANDVLNSGDVIIIDDTKIDITSVSGQLVNSPSTIDWDGKDKIAATQAVAVSRSLWASGSNSLFAWAMSMMPTTEWGQQYTAPVGCDTSNAGSMFNYSALSVTAAYDGTVLEIDPTGSGTWIPVPGVFDEGETYFHSDSTGGTCGHIHQGARVRSTDPAKPIQVVLITGQKGSNYASRDVNLVPDASLSSSYWIPVGNAAGVNSSNPTGRPARAYIYNLETTSLHVRCERPASPGPGTTFVDQTIAPGQVGSAFELTTNQAGHCYAVDAAGSSTPDPTRKFSGILTIDTTGQGADWALPFIPETGLSNQALVGLGAGRDWTSGTNPNENGSPLWVTPVCTTWFYVDWDNDGTPDNVDLNGDNDTGDTVNGIVEANTHMGFLVEPLQSVRLFRPGSTDQTGAFIYTRTAPNNDGEGGCNFAAAWGQDPATATGGAPGLDMGTVIVALRSVQSSKGATLYTDANGDGVANPLDVIEYVITINNIGMSPANVSVYDTIPANTTYVPGSTEFFNGTVWTPIADDGSGTPFPLDEAPPDGISLGSLPARESWQVRFRVTIDFQPVGNDFEILNCARLKYDDLAVTPCVSTDVVVPPEIEVTKTANPTTIPTTGGLVTYTFTVTNVTDVPVKIDSMVDSVFGPLAGSFGCTFDTELTNMGDSCSFTQDFTLPPADPGEVHLNIFRVVAKDEGGNITEDEDPEPVYYIDATPSIMVEKTADPTILPTSGGDVEYTFRVTNNGPVPVQLTSLTDDKFGSLNTNTECPMDTWLDPADVCEFTQTFNLAGGPPQSTHINTFTVQGEDGSGNPVEDDDDATVTFYPTNVCLDSAADNRRTDILGAGMGNPKKHRNIVKVMLPNWTNVVELYGQMAGKQEGAPKYVRFMYPAKNGYEQVNDITHYAPRHSAVFWFGEELDPYPHIRGRWFLQNTGVRKHIPRALILYPTYQTTDKYVDIFQEMDPSETQVYWDDANGWTPRQEVVIEIPAPQVDTTFNIKVAMVDNDKDARPIFVTMEAGGVSVTQAPIGPNSKDLLNIMQFTLENVPAGTSTITMTIESPRPGHPDYPVGGDSGAILGVTANYFCADVPLPTP